jgi:hypothetical protein
MYPTQTAQILKQREAQAQKNADLTARHLDAAKRACKPAAGLLGKAGLCRAVPA